MSAFNEGRKMSDKVDKLGKGTIIQHGTLNERIYLIKLDPNDFPDVLDDIFQLAIENNYTKIFAKVPVWAVPVFQSNGFITEAHIPDFYNKSEDVFFMSKFLNSDRLLGIENKQLYELSSILQGYSALESNFPLKNGFRMKSIKKQDAEMVTALYKQVFDSYPFPIFDPNYIVETIEDNVQYHGVFHGNKLVALASSEIDFAGKNAEMTDFATLPKYRGNQLAVSLLQMMESEMKNQGIETLYTIARLNSMAMNKTFLKLKYNYAGTLINNTHIAGKIESMNVYYKHL